MGLIDPAGLARLEAEVGHALDGADDGLRVLGHGEISLVLGWPNEAPTAVAKRLPPFAERDRAEAYGVLVSEYVSALDSRGIACLETEFHVTGSDGGWVAYVVQPLLDSATLGPTALMLRGSEDPTGASARDLLTRIVESIVAATDDRVGLDGQLSNWADTPDGLRYFDVTTPLLNDAEGRPRLDVGTLVSTLPAVVRPAVRHFVAPSITAQYHSPRGVLLDLAANLHKERLHRWVDATLVAANAHLDVPITPAEVRTHYRSDARTWEALLRLRRADRWMHQRVLGRRYGTLLPEAVER